MIPKPRARVRIAYGEPFQVEPGAEGIEAARLRAEQQLAQLVREAGWDDGATGTD
jgi:hypothetical protein